MPKQQLAPTTGPLLPLQSPGSLRQIRGSGSYGTRYGTYHQHQASPQTRIGGAVAGAVEIPLPLPKNQVMMALMELSSFTLKDQKETNLVDESDSGSGSSDGYEDEDALVFDGIESLGGQCGTYVVRERKGVMVQLHHPHHKTNEGEKENNVRDNNREGRQHEIWRVDSSASFLTAKSGNDLEHSTSFSPPTIVGYGQKVQIVDRVDGVFRLPRNLGFIVANDSQLVKVGAPLEQCCKIEGILSSLTASKLDLQKKLEQIDKDETNLNRQLKRQHLLPEVHPVISESLPSYQTHRNNSNSSNNTYHNTYEDDRNDFDMTASDRLSPSFANINIHSSYESGSVVSPTPISPPTNHSSVTSTAPSDMFQLSDDDEDHNIDNGEMDWRLQAIQVVDSLPDPISGDKEDSRPLSPFRRGIICGSSLFPGLGMRSELSGESAESVCSAGAASAGPCGLGSIINRGDEISGDRGIEMSYSVRRTFSNRSWTGGPRGRNENDSPYVNGTLNTVLSNTSIDFRTGMSGHHGLSSAVKDGRRPLAACRAEMRMMSEHRGIGSIRPIRKVGSPRNDANRK